MALFGAAQEGHARVMGLGSSGTRAILGAAACGDDLVPGPAQQSTLVRERTGFGSRLTEVAMSPLGIVSFVMTREMLRGVKARAEADT